MIENLFTFVRTLGNQRIEGKKFFVTQVGLLGTVSDNNGSIGTAGKVLSSTGNGVVWADASTSNIESLDDLSDVIISTASNGQLLRFNGSSWVNWTPNFLTSYGSLNDLSDVVLSGQTSGQILRYGIPLGSEDPNPVWYNWSPNFLTFASSINALADVTITSAATGQLLQWNGNAWVNWTPNFLTSYTETDTLATVTTRGNTTTNTITVGGATSNYLILSGASSLLESKGLLKWESDHNSVGIYYADGKHFDIGQSQMWYVKNTSDATLAKGTVVMATGAVGNSGNLEVQPLIADGTVSGRFALGIAMDDIAVGAFGFVKTEGTIRGIDTSEYTIGTVLYADPAIAGGLTSIEPTAPSLKLPIAFVVSAASNGAIGVRMTQGLDLQEIHDVTISSVANGQLLRYNAGVWSNWTPNFLTSFTETDPTVPSHVKTISTTDISNWNTAYGWGNHATQGYATQTWVGLNYYNEGEIDDFFSGAEPISGYNKSNWDTAFGWGNHASAGYLTSIPTPVNGDWWNGGFVFVGTDGVMEMGKYMDFHTSDSGGNADFDLRVTVSPGLFAVGGEVSATGGNSTNWNTAFGWGNHALAGYLTSIPDEYLTQPEADALYQPIGSYLTAEADTLATVTARGASTSTTLNLNGRVNIGNGLARPNALTSDSVAHARIGGADVHLYVASLEAASGYRVAVQAARTSDFASFGLDLQSNGGQLFYGGNEIATRTWVQSQGYLTSETDSQTLSWDFGAKNLSISNGNTVTLDGLATEEFVTSQGYLTSLPAHTHTIANVTGLQIALDGKAASSHTHSASDITSGTLSTDRLPKQELGISIVGNFGQWQNHGTYQNLNTDVAYWGWTFVQGSTNAPHQGSSQWYRGRFSLGDEYGFGTNPGDYWMEIAIPRFNQGDSAGNLFVRTCENGGINAWQGVRAAYSTVSSYVLNGTSTLAGVTFGNTMLSNQSAGRVLNFDGNGAMPSVWWTSGTTPIAAIDAISGGGLSFWANNGSAWWQQVSMTYGAFNVLTSLQQNGNAVIHAGNIGSQSVSYANSAGQAGFVTNQSGQLLRFDNRIIAPNETNAAYMQFGFTSWNNNNTAPWADYLHLRSYEDGSGGSDNLVMFRKDGIGMRIWQQSFGSASAYSSFVDVWTTGNFTQTNVNNWNTAYGWGNHADAPYWNVSEPTPQQVEAQQVTFAGDVIIQGTLTESSSIRFKENITPLDPALDKVNQLEAVSYNKIGVDDREIGLIAEDVAELFPEVVTYNEEGAPTGVQYQRLSVILLKAVQELTERVNKLENK